ncbi:helix-turn-helix domain-containing protein [Kribbella sp. NPDC050124]|uniref:helix-turn-helix domain-containing protein n=1 Tax=Kribbella sp. NPDC050124 TaxID=3364114 RepID=UPI0037935F11
MTDSQTRNVERQIEWYGEPLGDRFGRLLARLGLSQAQLAGVLGLSAPMLSQLMTGHRSKISSPAVLSRLLHLEAMVADPAWAALPPDEQSRRLADVRAVERSTLTTVTSEVQPAAGAAPARPQPAGDPVTVVQDVLRAVASAAELEAAAQMLEQEYPDLAEALRVLGTGRTPDARAYYARILAGPA